MKKKLKKVLLGLLGLEEVILFEHEHICNYGYVCGGIVDEIECGSEGCSSIKSTTVELFVLKNTIHRSGVCYLQREKGDIKRVIGQFHRLKKQVK